MDEVEVARRLKEHNPELLALRHEIEGAELTRSLAAKEYFPEVATIRGSSRSRSSFHSGFQSTEPLRVRRKPIGELRGTRAKTRGMAADVELVLAISGFSLSVLFLVSWIP